MIWLLVFLAIWLFTAYRARQEQVEHEQRLDELEDELDRLFRDWEE